MKSRRLFGKDMKKILVIDDEAWLRDMVQIALGQKGYEVLEAQDGGAGIALAQSALPDLVLCDVNMENMDGYATLSSLRSEPGTASIPVILMTGLADHAGMRHGMELGADDYLPKPFTLEGLYAAVEARIKKADTVRHEAEKALADLRDNISLMLPHELRTPLNGILAYGEILSSDAASLSPQEVAEMGEVIRHSGKRLERLVENFLIYAQIELLARDEQKLAALRAKHTPSAASLVRERARQQAQAADRLADLVLEVEDIPVQMSEEYLGRVVDELVQNAFKFSEGGTNVRLTLSRLKERQIELSVTDHGRGFSTEHIARVGAYMQFERKLDEQQGSGLGLTIARRLTELYGGTLDIRSERGLRTCVTVRLPVSVRDAQPLEAAERV